MLASCPRTRARRSSPLKITGQDGAGAAFAGSGLGGSVSVSGASQGLGFGDSPSPSFCQASVNSRSDSPRLSIASRKSESRWATKVSPPPAAFASMGSTFRHWAGSRPMGSPPLTATCSARSSIRHSSTRKSKACRRIARWASPSGTLGTHIGRSPNASLTRS